MQANSGSTYATFVYHAKVTVVWQLSRVSMVDESSLGEFLCRAAFIHPFDNGLKFIKTVCAGLKGLDSGWLYMAGCGSDKSLYTLLCNEQTLRLCLSSLCDLPISQLQKRSVYLDLSYLLSTSVSICLRLLYQSLTLYSTLKGPKYNEIGS